MQKSLFERPASLNDENRAEYEELLASVAAGVAPRDILEEFWVEDIATEAYNGRQLRRFKDSLLKSSARHGLKEAMAGRG